jgi:hypothetical protein
MSNVLLLNPKQDPIIVNLDLLPASPIPQYVNFAAFPAAPQASGFAIDLSTGALYCSLLGNWCVVTVLQPAV